MLEISMICISLLLRKRCLGVGQAQMDDWNFGKLGKLCGCRAAWEYQVDTSSSFLNRTVRVLYDLNLSTVRMIFVCAWCDVKLLNLEMMFRTCECGVEFQDVKMSSLMSKVSKPDKQCEASKLVLMAGC